MEPILRMKGVTKAFPGIIANDHIDLEIYKGEIHALVGENGAGKSTLMSILYGLYQPDEGEIYIRGEKTDISTPSVAINSGIGMVFQHFMLVPPLTVAENVILGVEPRKGIFVNRNKATKDVENISQQYGLKVDVNAKIETLSVGMQQRVEIIKTLYKGAEILILDEPTAVLTPQEVKELFATLRSLVAQGKTIIFITHKLKEVMELSNRITVLRNGKVVGNVMTSETNEAKLAKMMVGREVLLRVEKTEAKIGENVLKVDNVQCKNSRNLPALKGVSFEVKRGEILGIAGVEGNGQSELLEVLTGLRKATSGKVSINNEDITNATPKKIKEKKVAHISEDRHKRGLVLDYTVEENLIMGYHDEKPFAKGGVLNFKSIEEHSNDLIPKFDIRTPSKEVLAKSLSGGNQQKIVVAREFYLDPDLLIASQPTRGVDVGAIEFIHRQIIELRDRQKAVLLISAELQEIMSLSDRIAVMYEGEIVDIVDAKTATEAELGLMMAGIKGNESSERSELVDSGKN